MERSRPLVWEPGGTEANTSAATARRYRKPSRCLRWTDFKALPRLGASVALYTMFSLTTLLVVAIGVAGFVFGEQAARGQIYWQFEDLVGGEGAQAIQKLVENASRPSTGIIAAAAGLATLFFGATTAIAELRAALNIIWGVPPVKPAPCGAC